MSPFLAWRGTIYTIACFAGIAALCLVLVQPLLAGGYLPGLAGYHGRRAHIRTGTALVLVIVVHVAGLWITSPPDMVDALLFASPTAFSPFGVISMWAIFAVAAMVLLRRTLPLAPRTWRFAHKCLAAIIVIGGVVHALLIEGIMEPYSKAALCAVTVVVAAMAMRRGRRKNSAASTR